MSEEKAKEKLQELGRNLLKEKKRTPWYIKLLQEYNSFFAWLLWIGAILSFIAYGIDKANSSNVDFKSLKIALPWLSSNDC